MQTWPKITIKYLILMLKLDLSVLKEFPTKSRERFGFYPSLFSHHKTRIQSAKLQSAIHI